MPQKNPILLFRMFVCVKIDKIVDKHDHLHFLTKCDDIGLSVM